MKKLNSVIYHKLLLQIEEAKEQGMEKLASVLSSALVETDEQSPSEYSRAQLEEDIYQGLWKLAQHVMIFHNLESADIQKVDGALQTVAEKFMQEVELSLGADEIVVGSLEPKVPGEQ